MNEKQMKFLIVSEFGELLDLAIALQSQGNEVLMHCSNHDYSKIGEGIVPKTDDSWIHMGKGYVWVFDGCERGKRQDWLRSKGEIVFGGNEKADKLENDRQLGQQLFRSAGFKQPESQNFKDFAKAKEYAKSSKSKLILKQNGSAPKSINHMGKFDDGSDMLYHLDELEKKWNVPEFGPIDFDLMEVVEGTEMAASAFFNGHDWMRDAKGKVVGFINFEEKKEVDGNLGETTGEMGTTFIGVDEDNSLFKDMLMRPKIKEVLQKINYRGVFDINCIKTKDGMVALEPTCRFGVPTTSYEFDEGLDMSLGKLISAVAKGEDIPVSIHRGIGMVMVVAAKPYPVESDIESASTSLGEKLWILDNGKPVKDFNEDQKKHIHLQNFTKKDGDYLVATKNGYLLTVTARGKTIEETRDKLIEYIKSSLYVSGMKFRSDIGKRIEESTGIKLSKAGMEEKLKQSEKELEDKKSKELQDIKSKLKKEIYG